MSLRVVIVLGNRISGQKIHAELKGRMDVAIQLFRDKNANYLILSGGKTNPSIDLSEAEVMKDYALMKVIPSEAIILEENSMDTIGNAYFTRKIVDKIKCLDIYVISSCYHMKRVKFIFEMCYGENYNMFFNYCFPFHNQNAEKKEKDSIKLAKDFFKNIMPGDLDKIEKRLFSIHALYRS